MGTYEEVTTESLEHTIRLWRRLKQTFSSSVWCVRWWSECGRTSSAWRSAHHVLTMQTPCSGIRGVHKHILKSGHSCLAFSYQLCCCIVGPRAVNWSPSRCGDTSQIWQAPTSLWVCPWWEGAGELQIHPQEVSDIEQPWWSLRKN